MHIRPTIRIALLTLLLVAAAPLAVTSMAQAPSLGPVAYQSLAAAGSDLICGIRADDTLDCWGRSQISVAEAPSGTFNAVAAARRVACGVRSDATMQCWGRWYSDVDHTSTARAPGGTFIALDLAEEQGCAIRTDGSLSCFGNFDRMSAGPGVTPIEGTFTNVAAIHDDFGGCGIRTDSTIACWGANEWGQATPPDGAFTAIAAGRMTLCAIAVDGELTCWGRGLYGAAQPPQGRYTNLAIGGDTGCATRLEDQRLVCWGADIGQPPDVPAAALAIGDTIAGLIGVNGVVHTWGETRYWPLWGFGDPGPRDGFGAFRIVGQAPPTMEQGAPVDFPLATTPAHPSPEFRLVNGSLPPGLKLTREGRLQGAPQVVGSYGPLTVVADNGTAPMDAISFTLTVLPAPEA